MDEINAEMARDGQGLSFDQLRFLKSRGIGTDHDFMVRFLIVVAEKDREIAWRKARITQLESFAEKAATFEALVGFDDWAEHPEIGIAFKNFSDALKTLATDPLPREN